MQLNRTKRNIQLVQFGVVLADVSVDTRPGDRVLTIDAGFASFPRDSAVAKQYSSLLLRQWTQY